jgi:hypothetical protein
VICLEEAVNENKIILPQISLPNKIKGSSEPFIVVKVFKFCINNNCNYYLQLLLKVLCC